MAASNISRLFLGLWAFLSAQGELRGLSRGQRIAVYAVMSACGAAAVLVIRAVGFDRTSLIQCAVVGALLGLVFGLSGRAAARHLKSQCTRLADPPESN